MKHYYTPEWLSYALGIAIFVPVFLLARFAQKNSPVHRQNKVYVSTALFFLLYFGYVLILQKVGLFQEVSFPPRVLIFTTFPYAIFLFGIIYRMPITKQIFENATLDELVSLHIFRLLGSTFIIVALYDALPKPFAFIAGCGDVITALTSIWVVNIIKQRKVYTKKVVLIWNTFGLMDIIITSILANLYTKISIDTGQMGVDALSWFPFSLIPAFAPPTIIFLHVMIYKKLQKK